jgi:hypothetical protein
MKRARTFLSSALFPALLAITVHYCSQAQTSDVLASPGYRIGIGLGYLNTGGDITTIWGNGFAMDFVVGYRPWPSLGFDFSGIYSTTSISDWMKNRVYVEYPSSGDREHRETTGGNHYELLFGPTWFIQIPGTSLVASLGAGGRYSASQEAGMGNIEDYYPRWTLGWGGYAQLGVELYTETGMGTIVYGVRGRYLIGQIKVNDFYYDRVYGKMSYDEIAPTYLGDRRIHISMDVILEFH